MFVFQDKWNNGGFENKQLLADDRDGKMTIFFGPARSSFSRPGPARNKIFNFRPVWGPAKIS